MRKASCTKVVDICEEELLTTPAYHKTGCEWFRELKRSLEQVECAPGRELMQKQFGQLLGMPKSTVHDWYHGQLPPQIRFLFCGIERLPDAARAKYLRWLCRECPRLGHSRLANDPQTTTLLKALILKSTGLTFVRGDSDEARTFLVTALGHSASGSQPQRVVCGLDIHPPETFVPVYGVTHFRRVPSAAITLQVLRHCWQRIEGSTAHLFIFNGVWNLAPEFHPRIFELAKRRHVLVADQFPPNIAINSVIWKAKVQVVTVATDSNRRILTLPNIT